MYQVKSYNNKAGTVGAGFIISEIKRKKHVQNVCKTCVKHAQKAEKVTP